MVFFAVSIDGPALPLERVDGGLLGQQVQVHEVAGLFVRRVGRLGAGDFQVKGFPAGGRFAGKDGEFGLLGWSWLSHAILPCCVRRVVLRRSGCLVTGRR